MTAIAGAVSAMCGENMDIGLDWIGIGIGFTRFVHSVLEKYVLLQI